MRELRTVPAGAGNAGPPDKHMISRLRGNPFTGRLDHRFIVFALLSLSLHIGFLIQVHLTKLPPPPIQTIEQIDERFAKLIIDKPIPKIDKSKQNTEKSTDKPTKQTPVTETEVPILPTGKQPVTAAQVSVARRTQVAEERVRTVGVLGMLTGTGTTARGPAVVDVLNGINKGKEHLQDLSTALDNMSGLKQTASADLAGRQLVRSKDIAITRQEGIDDLVAGIRSGAQTEALQKRGDFVIQRPESIEGAASSSAKRDNTAINSVVSANKAGVRMSYEKFLNRIPGLAGKITVKFTIASSGAVSSITVMENSTGCDDLEKEIVRKIRMWQFDAIADGDVTVTYPFIFKPS